MQALQVSPLNLNLAGALAKLKNSVTLPNGQTAELYNAGLKPAGGPDYSRIFARDGLTSAFLLGDMKQLHDLLLFCADTMGTKVDPRTGEEPGKVAHEWPGVDLRGYNSQYVATDTTALWLIGLHEYWLGTGDVAFIAGLRSPIAQALAYIKAHLREDLFWDDPKFSQAERSAVLSGCWRDGGFAERDGGHQVYPATYFMVNLLVVKALRGLNALQQSLALDDQTDLSALAERIKSTTLQRFYLPQTEYYSPMIDQLGAVETLYLDSIWSLYFLEPDDLPQAQIQSLFGLLPRLQTPYGYLSREQTPGTGTIEDRLVVGTAVWPLEQAYLALLAERLKQKQVVDECKKAATWLDTTADPYSEYIALDLTTETPRTAGCNIQLWTIAYRQLLTSL